MPGLRDILDAATPGPWVYHSFEDDGYFVEDVRPEDGRAIIAYGEKCFLPEMETANLHLAALAPELAAELLDLRERHREAVALCLDMGELLRKPVDEIEEGDAADVLARLSRIGVADEDGSASRKPLGAGDSNQNEKEQT